MKTSNTRHPVSDTIKWVCFCGALLVFTEHAIASTNTPTQVALPLLNEDFESTNGLPGWRFLTASSSHADLKRDAGGPLSEKGPHSLRLNVTNAAGRCVVVSTESALKLDAGTWYDVTFSARSEPTNRGFGLVVSLETADGQKICGRATIPEIGGQWKQHTLAIPAGHSTSRGRLSIALFEVGTVWLDDVSLSPRKASGN
jgi:hypothetical protein